jgi:predicted transcriptional regulator
LWVFEILLPSKIMGSLKKSENISIPKKTADSADAPEGYAEHSSEIATLMGWFFLRYLGRMYEKFEGDFVLAMVLGEIAHHNICHYYSKGKPRTRKKVTGLTSHQAWNDLEPCNAFSLSTATGIPRETIRRKISILVKRGWIQRHSTGGYIILPNISEHFSNDLNLQIFKDLMETSEELRNILKGQCNPDG